MPGAYWLRRSRSASTARVDHGRRAVDVREPLAQVDRVRCGARAPTSGRRSSAGCRAAVGRACRDGSVLPWTTSVTPTSPATSTRCCRLTGEFTLRSGQVVVGVLRQVPLRGRPGPAGAGGAGDGASCCLTDTELLGGLEMGGIPIATMVSSLTGQPALFVRKQAKDLRHLQAGRGPGRRRPPGHPGRGRDHHRRRRARRRRGRCVRRAPTVETSSARSTAARGREPARRRRPRGPGGAHQGRAGRRPGLARGRLSCACGCPGRRCRCRGFRRGRCRRPCGSTSAVPPPLVADRDHREAPAAPGARSRCCRRGTGRSGRGSSRAA